MSYKVYINGKPIGFAKEITIATDTEEIPVRAGHVASYVERKLYIELPEWGKNDRPDWDDYFRGIAKAVAARGDCSRRQVGAIIVGGDHRIVSTGYNGVSPGISGCLSNPCPRVAASVPCPGYSDCRSVHAEANAIIYADHAKCVGSTIYSSEQPCEGCMKLIRAARIKRVVFPIGEYSL